MMKRQILITLLATALLGTAGIAQAGDRHRGHHNGHHNQYGYARHNYGSHHYGSRHYGRSHHYRPYRHYGYGHGHQDHYKGLKIAAGALILGSIIHAANNDRRRNAVYRSRPVASSRDYYRVDADGQCVEVRLNRQGQEVWTYVDSSYCY